MDDSDLIEQLRAAIRDSGLTLVEIARRSTVDQPRLSRFVRGQRSLTLESASLVCRALGLRLIKAGKSETEMLPGGEKQPDHSSEERT